MRGHATLKRPWRGVAEKPGYGQNGRTTGRVESGCTSRGAWATKKVNTQVRVLPCTARGDTRRRGALSARTKGQVAVGLFVRAEGCGAEMPVQRGC